MPILFRTLLSEAGIDPHDVRMLRHTLKGVDLYAAWRNDPKDFEAYQSVQRRSARSYFARPWWASFISLPDERAVFVGMYRATFLGDCPAGYDERITPHPASPDVLHLYECQLADELREYVGRLQVDFPARNWRQLGEGRHEVVQLHDRIRDPDFPGLLRFIRPLSEIPRLPDSWRVHLRLAKGIYLLTCPRTQEQYVGQAAGEDGFLGRWMGYANGHGGNIRLRSRDASDYQVTILEVAGSSSTPQEIGQMELRWKEKLQSRAMGLNAN